MNVNGTPTRTIWLAEDGCSVQVIDQTKLPHTWEVLTLRSMAEAARAIKDIARGGGAVGADDA